MTTLTTRDDISIAVVILYTVFLGLALYLINLHKGISNFRRGNQWFYIVILSLLRIIGSGLQLGTISKPDDLSLYIGSIICSGIGVSPLLLSAACILLQANEADKGAHVLGLPFARYYRIIQLIMITGLILGIIGGDLAGSNVANTGVYTPHPLSKASVGLFIAAYVLIIGGIFVTSREMRATGQTMRPLWLVLIVSLPFLAVRLVYSSISTFGDVSGFNLATGNIWYFLGMAVIMEICVVVMYEGAGLIERFNGTENAARRDVEMWTPAPPQQQGYTQGYSQQTQQYPDQRYLQQYPER